MFESHANLLFQVPDHSCRPYAIKESRMKLSN